MQSMLAEYQAQRVALIKQDRALRPDHSNADKYTTAELKADDLLRKLRAAEASSVWASEHENIPHPFPGMEFLTGTPILDLRWNLLTNHLVSAGHHRKDRSL